MLTQDWPTLDVLRLRYIDRVLEKNGGNKTRAADMLGIDRRTLNRILARERAKAAAAARVRPPEGAKSQTRPIAAAGAPAPVAAGAPVAPAPVAAARG
jgi:hypothetical protein